MIVKENIDFKRGVGSKKSLGVGRTRLQPTIYANQFTRTANSAERIDKLEKLEEEYGLMESIGYYDVFLVDKNIPESKLIDIFENSAGNIEMPFETIGYVIAGVDQNAMGGYDFNILEIEEENWQEWDIADLRVLSSDGSEDVDISRFI